MDTKLTVPIAVENLEIAEQQIKTALAAGAEAIELRTDYLEGLGVELVQRLTAEAKNLAGQSVPIIVTCRDKQQGGAADYSNDLRISILVAALEAGAELIDFEYENFLSSENHHRIKQALSQHPKARLILSAHNFETKFDNIDRLFRDILTAYPTAIPKLVYKANHINDCFDAFDLLHKTSGDLIVFCMGDAGVISRIIAKKLNCFVTFASIDDKTATAPGQLTIRQLKELYRWDDINADTELYGVIGSPVAHSAGPAAHNACFAEIGANKLYVPLLVEGDKNEFDKFMDNIFTRGWLAFHGFSVTIPHKQNALNYVKEKKGVVEPLAERISAANTLLIGADGKPAAYNTDYKGALDAITSGLGVSKSDLKDMPIAIIGAGGVARAIVAGLSDTGAKIKIYNRTVEKAERLAAEFGCDFAGLDDLPNVDAKLVINCTSIGMYPHTDETPIIKQFLKSDMAVFDSVYNPVETLLLKDAKEIGAKTISGLDMFINQAMAQFRLFTGQNASRELMQKTVAKELIRR